jgi:hypothetical protein
MATQLRFHSPGPGRAPVTALAAVLAFGALTFGVATTARAETQIAVDLDYALPVDSIGDDGGGFAIRLGQQLHIPLLALTPEIVYSHHSFTGRGAPATNRGMGGLRIGFGELFRLGPFAHLGVGRLSIDLPGASRTAFTYDVGAFFDLTLIPFINLGVHGAYNQISGDEEPSFHWMTFGAHAELIF